MTKQPSQQSLQPHINSVQSPILSPNDDVTERLIRLVSVGLKEATMDSPSFRASVNYMHIAIIQCSQTINSSISVLQKYAENWSNFINATNDVQNVFSQHLQTSQFISSDITKPCMNLFLEGQRIINDSSLSLLDVRDLSFANMNSIVEIDIPKYLELRNNFDRIQDKYDIISANFMQLPKHYDPSKTRDDALQLFEIRKQYINISMSLWISIKQLEIKLSKASTDTTNFFWKSFDKRSTSYGAKLSDAIGLSDIVNSIKQLNMSADLQKSSCNLLIDDLNRARLNAENGAQKIYTPSPDIKDFDSSIINNSNIIINNDQKILEKHGWVFIKSAKISGKGDVWIKRWLFVKNEVFGFLAISPNGQYVQETDKIGVLLVDFKYCPSEDRKFCFKISSTDFNIIIQVETSAQLRSWLTVFKNVKESVLSSESSKNLALKRYPPALRILKLEPIVAIDFKLIDFIKQDPQIEKTTTLIELQLSNLSIHTSIETPLRTSITEKIIMAHLYLTSTTVPSALTANFWGYVNWGLYFALDDVNKVVMLQQNKSVLPNPTINLRYPKGYSEELRIADAELRALFEAYVSDMELTLLKFTASWSPNSEQRLYCTIFVTTRNFYVYSHTCGLISIVPIPITNFLNSDVFESSNGNTLMKVYFVSGLLLKLQLFTTDANIIKSKFNYILSNQSSTNPDGIEIQVKHLDEISKRYFAMKRNKKLQLVTGGVRSDDYNDIDKITGIQIDVPTRTNQVDLHPSLAEGNTDIRINYAPEMNLVVMRAFNAPAKAIFHMLFGDESSLTQCTLPIFTSLLRVDRITHSLWRCDSHQDLTRVVWSSSFKVPCAKQKIEAMNNNKYYNIIQETPYLKFVLGIKRKIYMRFVIYSLDSRKCQVMVYYSVGDEKTNVLNWFTRRVTHQIMLFRAHELERKLQVAVAEFKEEHKKIATAIKNYGPITKYDSDIPTKEEELFHGYVNFVPIQVFSSFYYEMINLEIEKLFNRLFIILRTIYGKTFAFVSTHVLFLSILGASLLLNLLLIGMSTRSFWRERTVARHVKELVGDKHLIERAVSIKEIDELVYPDSANVSAYRGGSECFWKFAESENLVAVAKNERCERGKRELELSSKLLGLRIERNEVLTKLNLLDYMERELILKEWNNWLSSEIANCERVRDAYPDYYSQISAYCSIAGDEMQYLYSNLM